MKHSSFFWLVLAGISIELILISIYYLKNKYIPQNPNGITQFTHDDDPQTAFETCKAKSHQWWPFGSQKVIEKHPQRDFSKAPIKIGGSDFKKATLLKSCDVGCVHYPPESLLSNEERGVYFDASFVEDPEQVKGRKYMGLSILRTMESSVYKPESSLRTAKQSFDVVMTPRLDSDVPVPYFSWALYDIMKSSQKTKVKDVLSSIVYSNCDARSFRQEAVDALLAKGDSPKLVEVFGLCSAAEKRLEGDKMALIGKYKFYLAFENSIETDYVTEKFFQSLVEGAVPIVIGAPNVQQFAPANNSILVINTVDDVSKVAEQMMHLDTHDEEYQAMLKWKQTGPSPQYKALVDLSNVHSSCRVCMHLADRIRQQERKVGEQPGLCKCDLNPTTSIFKFYVRERGRFQYFSAYLYSWEANMKGLVEAVMMAFAKSSLETGGYFPTWSTFRDENGRRPKAGQFPRQVAPALHLYKIYLSTGAKQGQVLFGKGFTLDSDEKVAKIFNSKYCLHLEVIFI